MNIPFTKISSPITAFSAYNLGILGGSFDPIHHGHLHPVKSIAKQLSFSTITLMPAFLSPFKQASHSSAAHRLQLVNLACKDDPFFTVDSREILSNKTCTTIDTLKKIKLENPSSTLYFFMGLDSLLSFHQWHKFEEIMSLCNIVVSMRPPFKLNQDHRETQKLIHQYFIKDTAELANKKSGALLITNACLLNISSTELRQNIANSIDCTNYLSPSVNQYILNNHLYR